jgi:hypothetical protein
MIDPKPADIGRKVVYRDRTGWKVEEGVITSFNDTCVFVRYARTSRSSTASRTLAGNYADQRAQTASLGPAGPDFGRHRRRHGTQRRRGAPGRSHFGATSHRVKNVLAAVQSIASQTLRQSGSLARFYSFTLPIRRPADCPPRTSLSFDRRQRRKRFSVPR